MKRTAVFSKNIGTILLCILLKQGFSYRYAYKTQADSIYYGFCLDFLYTSKTLRFLCRYSFFTNQKAGGSNQFS